ncbi:MAG: hypothetical protein HFI93_01800 [Lachnospiraceae bacterium]|nr:hypothetical protein [Lachnospiraceae bacterium]
MIPIREMLAAYQPWQWLMFFFLYNFIGWIYETAFVSATNKCFENRGFLWGPQIPLYGSGALLMLFLALPVKDRPALCFLAGMAGATALEFIVGITMEAVFKVKYWDYSNFKTNVKGVICLPASLLWGVFTLVLVNWLHRPMEALVLGTPDAVVILLDVMFFVMFATDFVMSLKAALELRSMLEAIVRLRDELNKVQEQIKEELHAHLKECVADYQQQLHILNTSRKKLRDNLLSRHRGIRSERFEGAMKEIREHLPERLGKKKRG